ncbi:MAG: hypothetical protein JRI68_33110, partial [Deltaproteobacteria bacterium]|nr:hypothetical protein [Deltaproteobacteria bacterium]
MGCGSAQAPTAESPAVAYPPCVPDGEVDLPAMVPTGARFYFEVGRVETLLRGLGVEAETLGPAAGAKVRGVDRLVAVGYPGKNRGVLLAMNEDYWGDGETAQKRLASAGPTPGGGLRIALAEPPKGEDTKRWVVWYPRRCALAAGSKSFVDGVD